MPNLSLSKPRADVRFAEAELRKLLKETRRKSLSAPRFWRRLALLTQENLGFALLDHGREVRKGYPEVVFGEGKTSAQLLEIVPRLLERSGKILITRLDEGKAFIIRKKFPGLRWNPLAGCLHFPARAPRTLPRGSVLVLAAGTSDLAVAEEARLTASLLGCRTRLLADVGVAGLPRLLARLPELRKATVIVAAAGMEAALPGVVAGLVGKPVIALPTSVGYGTGAKGYAALLSSLNSCAPGLLAVNIDNGFGAGYAAAQILWAVNGKR